MADIKLGAKSYSGIDMMNIETPEGESALFIDDTKVAFLESDNYEWSEDLIPGSIDTDGSIYNGIGYKSGYRLNSSATEVALSGSAVTGYIPYSENDVFCIKANNTSTPIPQYVWLYDENFKSLFQGPSNSIYPRGIQYDIAKMSFFATGVQYDYTKAKYIRFSLQAHSTYPVTIHKATRPRL